MNAARKGIMSTQARQRNRPSVWLIAADAEDGSAAIAGP